MTAKRVTAHQLGLDEGLAKASDEALFKWLIASFLFGKPIQQSIAEKAYRVIIEQRKRDTPEKLGSSNRTDLVRMLGEARYVRYDISTAARLVKLCRKLNEQYGGKVSVMHRQSANRMEFEKRLAEFEGVGPKTIEIFMREAAPGLY
ncbi:MULTISPECIES: DNA methylase [unclassified Pseudomonas]|uniref:DNA methylase n=1 Tax=unclassified Pseudomonas TaxID=196821 RepID=UPI002447C43A|nr:MULTISPECIES: DNA methylase [unclassified Pseudomonas]MDG9924418.1 DNA methylase [Pseudomonas sp. GD04045]MDH0035242.1 DNA methylase [Pseudomonas sp. GD04019]